MKTVLCTFSILLHYQKQRNRQIKEDIFASVKVNKIIIRLATHANLWQTLKFLIHKHNWHFWMFPFQGNSRSLKSIFTILSVNQRVVSRISLYWSPITRLITTYHYSRWRMRQIWTISSEQICRSEWEGKPKEVNIVMSFFKWQTNKHFWRLQSDN